MSAEDTGGYEDWLRRHCPIDEDDLDYKHQEMADPAHPFPFFRGTYYLWARHWPETCPPLLGRPRVLAVGDLCSDSPRSLSHSDRSAGMVSGWEHFEQTVVLPARISSD